MTKTVNCSIIVLENSGINSEGTVWLLFFILYKNIEDEILEMLGIC